MEEERRQEELRNMIKGYISGIQEAKTQGNLVRSKQQQHEVVVTAAHNKDGKTNRLPTLEIDN